MLQNGTNVSAVSDSLLDEKIMFKTDGSLKMVVPLVPGSSVNLMMRIFTQAKSNRIVLNSYDKEHFFFLVLFPANAHIPLSLLSHCHVTRMS